MYLLNALFKYVSYTLKTSSSLSVGEKDNLNLSIGAMYFMVVYEDCMLGLCDCTPIYFY